MNPEKESKPALRVWFGNPGLAAQPLRLLPTLFADITRKRRLSLFVGQPLPFAILWSALLAPADKGRDRARPSVADRFLKCGIDSRLAFLCESSGQLFELLFGQRLNCALDFGHGAHNNTVVKNAWHVIFQKPARDRLR